MSMNMTGPLITMMGKFLSVLNQSATIQNNLMCVERSTSLSMIANQAESQVAEGTAQAMSMLAQGIAGIAGGIVGVAGGVGSAAGAVGEFSELGNLGKADSVVDMEEMPAAAQQSAEDVGGPLEEGEDGIEMTEFNPTTGKPVAQDDVSDAEEEDIADIETSQKESEAAKQKEIEMIKQKYGAFAALTPIGQSVSGLLQGLGGAIGSSFGTKAAEAQAAATNLGGLAQSVNSMMSSTESNYQNTMSLNTQLANGMFAAFTSWWGASTGR